MYFEDVVIRSIVEECWLEMPTHFPSIELDEWVIMPNHLHAIIIITPARRGVQLNAPTGRNGDNPFFLPYPHIVTACR